LAAVSDKKLICTVVSKFRGDNLFGPHILSNRPAGQNYKVFSENNMQDFFVNTLCNLCRELYFMHDGTPTHFSLVAHIYLNRKFLAQWVVRGGPVAWP
jgi:hypothetical protein